MASTTTRYFAGPWWKRKDFQQTAILWLILTPIIGYFCSEIQVGAMGAPASEVMATTERLMRIFTWQLPLLQLLSQRWRLWHFWESAIMAIHRHLILKTSLKLHQNQLLYGWLAQRSYVYLLWWWEWSPYKKITPRF